MLETLTGLGILGLLNLIYLSYTVRDIARNHLPHIESKLGELGERVARLEGPHS